MSPLKNGDARVRTAGAPEGSFRCNKNRSSVRASAPNCKPQLVATLIARRPPPALGRRNVYLYSVLFDGEQIVTDSADPECDLARALVARGFKRGWITIIDSVTG